MKKRIIVVSALLLAVSGILFLTERNKTATGEREAEENIVHPRIGGEEAQQFLAQMIRDPQTGTIPYERLQHALDQIHARKHLKSASMVPVWESRGPANIQGRVMGIMVDKRDTTHNTVFVCTDTGGLWKTENACSGNPTWVCVNDFFGSLQTHSMVQNPANLDEMYLSTGNLYWLSKECIGVGIYKSVDGGTTWTHLDNTNDGNFAHIGNMVMNTAGAIFAATNESGIERSTDGGLTWTKVLAKGIGGAKTNQAFDLQISKDTLYASTADFKIYKSGDGGNTWRNIKGTINAVGNCRLAAAPSNPNRLYVFVEWERIFRTDNGGNSWVEVHHTDPNAYGNSFDGCISMAVDPQNPNRVYAGGINYHVSADSGLTWKSIGGANIHVDEHVITCATSDTVFFGTDGCAYLSTNCTSKTPVLSFVSNNLHCVQYYAIAIHPDSGTNYFLGGAQDNGTLRATGAGFTAATDMMGGDGGFSFIDQRNPNIQIGSFQGPDVMITGNNWKSSTGVSTIPNTIGYFITPTDYDSYNKVLYSCTGNKNQYTYVSGIPKRNKVTAVTMTAFGNGKTTVAYVSPNKTTTVYFGIDNGYVVKVTDAAAKNAVATVIMKGAKGWISSIAIEPGNENHIVVVYSSFGVPHILETKNGGTSWANISNNFPDMPVYWTIFAPGRDTSLLLATHLGVWITEKLDSTATLWKPFNDGLANVIVRMIKSRASDNTVVAGTHGRGIFTSNYFTGSSYFHPDTTPTTPIVVSVGSALANNHFSVYPNPVTDKVTIVSPVKGKVLVRIISLSGQVVYTGKFADRLVVDRQQIGKPGMYVVYLVYDNHKLTEKIEIR